MLNPTLEEWLLQCGGSRVGQDAAGPAESETRVERAAWTDAAGWEEERYSKEGLIGNLRSSRRHDTVRSVVQSSLRPSVSPSLSSA